MGLRREMKGKLFRTICDTRTLYAAFRRIHGRRLAKGASEETRNYELQLDRRLQALSRGLKEGKYAPSRASFVPSRSPSWKTG